MNHSTEPKKDYSDIISSIPDYFWQPFAGELAAIFGFDIFNPWSVDDFYYVCNAGWGKAFEITCKKLGLDRLLDSYDILDWEESDLFDDAILYTLKQKLYEFKLYDTNPYYNWLNTEFRWMKQTVIRLGGFKILMRTVIFNEEDQKIVEQLAGNFGVSEYDIIHESVMLYYKIIKMKYSDRCKVMNSIVMIGLLKKNMLSFLV